MEQNDIHDRDRLHLTGVLHVANEVAGMHPEGVPRYIINDHGSSKNDIWTTIERQKIRFWVIG